MRNIFLLLWPRRLHAQSAVLGTLLFAGVIGAYTWRMINDLSEIGTVALEGQARALADNVASASAGAIVARRYSEIEELLLRSTQFPDVLRIQVADPSGRVLSDVTRRGAEAPQPRFDTPHLNPPAEARPQRESAADRLVIWQPIEAGAPIGWVRVEYGLRLISEARDEFLYDGLITGLIAIAASIALFILFLRRPMRAITRATEFASRLDERRGTPYAADRGAYEVERLGEALDRTSRRLHEQEQTISATTQRLRSVLAHAVDGIVTLDAHGAVESCNPAAERLFGCRAGAMIGQRFSDFIPDLLLNVDETADTDPLPRTETGEIRVELEASAQRPDGARFPVLVGVGEMQIEGERLFVVVVHDISEQKRLERMKDDFISSVSHELRTPLTAIHGSLGLMADGAVEGLSGKARGLAEIAYKNSNRLVRIVNDIVDFEKIESGELSFDLRIENLLPLVQRAVEANRAFARQNRVELMLESATTDARVMADAGRLEQALTNLLVNAIKFSPPGNEVTVTVTRHEEHVRIAVADRGPGIPEEFRDHLFQKFVQVNAADLRYKAGAGLGLGLGLAKTIVERMGGAIDFVSHPGAGTTFFVELPEIHQA